MAKILMPLSPKHKFFTRLRKALLTPLMRTLCKRRVLSGSTRLIVISLKMRFFHFVLIKILTMEGASPHI
jgi:hypothetical protein